MDRLPLCDLGIAAKKKLVEMNKSQSWLIAEIKKKTELYVDNGLLQKIWTGKRAPQKIIQAINNILFEE